MSAEFVIVVKVRATTSVEADLESAVVRGLLEGTETVAEVISVSATLIKEGK